MTNTSPKLIVIAGPTAIGKTAISIKLAQQLKAEIFSADSRQFFRELTIGTAKPEKEELSLIKHHFINNKSIQELYSAGEFEKDVVDKLTNYYNNNNIALLVGGSGMYINAVCNGLDEMPRNLLIRNTLNDKYQKNGITPLQKELLKLDPVQYNKMDINNPQRVIRALEICRITKKPFSSLQQNKSKKRNFTIKKFFLYTEKESLHQRIDSRVDSMVECGLFEEVKMLKEHQHLNALNTVGYKEVFQYYNGNISKDIAIAQIKSNTKKYAKRQITWFKKDKNYNWINNTNSNNALKEIIKGAQNT